MLDFARERRIKAIVADFMEAISRGARIDERLIAEDYRPHCAPLPGVPVLEAGATALRMRLQQRGAIPVSAWRSIADGDHVWVHSRFEGAVPIAGIDIFRFDADGRIAEHWNVRQIIPDDDARGWNRFAGGSDTETVLDEEGRLKMRALIRRSQTEVWGEGRADLVFHYYSPEYVQHNPDMPGGAQRIHQIVSTEMKARLERTGAPFPIDFHMIGANGDLIFLYYSVPMVGIGRNPGEMSRNADIFRVGPDGRFIEHWDVLEMASEPLPDDKTLF